MYQPLVVLEKLLFKKYKEMLESYYIYQMFSPSNKLDL